MKKLMMMTILAACAAAMMTGCRAVTVENFGEEIARDAEEKPVTLADGRIQTVKKGWKVHHNQHWMVTKADSIEAHVRPEEISFAMGGLNTEPSPELGKLVDTSLKGAAELAAKIGAAIATSGTSAGADAISAAAISLYNRYKAAGGTDESAKVAASNGAAVVTGLTASGETVTCADGSCSVGGSGAQSPSVAR